MSDAPSRLGKYEIIRILGTGAMGVVYEAIDRFIDRRVAIKTIRNADLDEDEAAEQLRRFLIEARAGGKLNHPHIVSLYDHGEEAGITYLVMELVEGRELQRYFDDGVVFEIPDAVRLMGELLDALSFSHRQGVVHRDVKPENIFITEAGTVKLGDFGIARIESTQKTRAGIALGTPTHMAPEQIRGEAADGRSDLYAAGVILYQLLTGQRPFSGTMLTMALKVLNEPAPRPSSINPQVTPALDAVAARALQKQAANRFQTAGEFWQALAQAVGLAMPITSPLPDARSDTGIGLRSRLDQSTFTNSTFTTHAGTGGSAAPPASTAAPAVPSIAVRKRQSRRVVAALGAFGVLALAGWAATAWLRKVPAETRRPTTALPAPVRQPPVPAAPRADGRPPQQLPTEPVTTGINTPTLPAPTPPAPAPAPEPAPTISASPPPAQPNPKPSAPPRQPAADGRTSMVPAQSPANATLPAKPARPEKCSDILLKASLEPLTIEESRILRRECQ